MSTRSKRIWACPPGHTVDVGQSGGGSSEGSPTNFHSQTQGVVFVKGLRKFLSDEQKLRLLVEYTSMLGHAGGSRKAGVAERCVRYGVGPNYPARLMKTFKMTGSVTEKHRISAPRKLTQSVQEELTLISTEKNGDVTYRELSEELEKRTGVHLSHTTIRDYIKHHWKVVKKQMKPPLSEAQMAARLKWAQENLHNWEDWVDVDEEWFYLWIPKGTLKLEMVIQSSNSPDCNTNDLCFFP